MARFNVEILKKKAQIDSSFIAEAERQEKILFEIRNELAVARKSLSVDDQILFDHVLSGFTERVERLPHYAVRKAVIYCKLKEIFDELKYFIDDHFQHDLEDNKRLTKKQIERILINFFRNVDDAIKIINDSCNFYDS